MDGKGVRSHSHAPAHVMLKTHVKYVDEEKFVCPVDNSLFDSIISAIYKKTTFDSFTK